MKIINIIKLRKKLKKLMVEHNMNFYTIKGVLKLLKTEEELSKTIEFIKRYSKMVDDHQLRQFIVRIKLWEKD